MAGNIGHDTGRFRQVVRGAIKQNLRKYMSHGEMLGRKGKDLVSIPVPQVEIPHFRFGRTGAGGVGQGDGEPGTPLGMGEGDGDGQAGNQPGEHILEVELTFEELAALLGEELALPRIEPKGKRNITSHVDRYTGISRAGPESLRHFKRTYKEALKRQLISGTYDLANPRVVPFPEDKRYRSWKVASQPESSAVIIYMMDVSGSMVNEHKEIVRLTAFWIDTWLRAQYHAVETRYIIHDAEAREVDQHTFYHTRESGGTVISSAFELCNQIVDQDYSLDEWNIYPFHFSDGDNWGHDDTQQCVDLLSNQLLPKCNMFCYGQVRNSYRSGQFLAHLNHAFRNQEKLIATEIPDRDCILDAIKVFLGKGK